MTPEQDLILKTASLSRATSGVVWEAFLKAFKEYGDVQMRLCVEAAPEHLARLQGRAQQCASLLALFGDAGKTADRIASKRAANTAEWSK